MTIGHIGLAVLVAAIWGVNFVVIRLGLDAFPPLLLNGLRFLLAGLPFLCVFPKPPVAWRWIIGIGVSLGVIKFSLLFSGMDAGLSAGLASLVLQTQAFFTALLAAFFLSERPTWNRIIGMVVSFGGIAIIANAMDSSASITGLALVLAGAFFWGVANIFFKKAQAEKIDMVALIVWVSLIPPLPLFALSLMMEGWDSWVYAFTHITATGIGAIVYLSLISTIVGFAIWGKLLHTYKAALVAPFTLLVPIFGMSASALVLGEQFDAVKLWGSAIVIVGLAINVWPKKRTATTNVHP